MTICAIHQPNFFPWLGYFDKIAKADHFIFLDAVDYPKSGSGMGSWCNRVKLKVNKEPRWVGCPIKRVSGELKINDAIIDDGQPWRKKLLKTIEQNYGKAKHYNDVIPMLNELIHHQSENIATYNIHAVRTIAEQLGLSCKFHLQSELNVPGQSNELLINLVKAVDADVYLCGGGASGYQDDELFKNQGIHVQYQNFNPEPYTNSDDHTLGLSVIDCLMKSEHK